MYNLLRLFFICLPRPRSPYSAVTTASLPRAGETLILHAKGLGPTTASLNPGGPFPSEPQVPAINQIGLPGSRDTYRVDFHVPGDIRSGSANLRISAARIKGPQVSIPIR